MAGFSGQIGVFLLILGSKLKINFVSIFEWISLQELKILFF
jgi:hypothetical protein